MISLLLPVFVAVSGSDQGTRLDDKDTSPAVSAAFSPDGMSVAIGGFSSWIDVWSLTAKNRIRSVSLKGGSIEALGYASPTRVRAYVGGVVRTLDVESGRVTADMQAPDLGMESFFIPGARYLVASDLGQITVCDIAARKCRTLASEWPLCRPTPDSGSFLVAGERSAGLFDLRTLKFRASVNMPLVGYDTVLGVSMANDGRCLVASGDGHVFRWTPGGALEALSSVGHSLDGFVAGRDGSVGGRGAAIYFLDNRSGKIVQEEPAKLGSLGFFVASPDGTRFIAGTGTGATLWDLQSEKGLLDLSHAK